MVTTDPTAQAVRPSAPRLVDVDVHHAWRSIADIVPYLPRYWADYVRETRIASLPTPSFHPPVNAGYRPGTRPEGGGVPGSDRERLRRDVLDGQGADLAILTGDFANVAYLPNNHFSAALARAINDWTVEHWLGFEPRFRGLVTVPVHAPTAAAAEIDRVGAHPAMVGVIVTAGSRLPYGNEVYHPIWAACARHDLPLVLHHGGTGMHLEGAPTAAGWPSTYLEWSAAMPQAAMAQVVSLVSEGVFDRFPDLRVVLLEVGFAWLPHLLWRFDKNWKALRSEVPWVRRPPSAYIRRHVRFSSQPLERPASDEQFQRLLQIVDAERSVLFGSGYPGWDADTPAAVLPAFPAAIRARVMADNAREVFRLDGGANGAAHGD